MDLSYHICRNIIHNIHIMQSKNRNTIETFHKNKSMSYMGNKCIKKKEI